MANFSIYEVPTYRSLNQRYTDLIGLVGSELWTKNTDQQLITETTNYGNILRSERIMEAKRTVPKRVFISHKREDKDEALKLAKFFERKGIEYWLDILDSRLANVENNPKLIANIIEIALLNSSHLIALITPNSKRSSWIPYEYGRVKDKLVTASNSAAYLKGVSQNNLPEYMQIAPIISYEFSLLDWVNRTKINL